MTKIYGEEEAKTIALDGVTFDIKKGEFVAIMGASGSGKSTLLHVLGFLDKHTGGEYYFEGKKIESYTEDDLAKLRNNKMGFVFQAFNLLPRTTVLENVKLPLLYSDIQESKWEALAMEAIDSVGLMHRLNHEPSQLSGGEKQRVAIARALILNPSVIFADEPTGNLDSKSGQIVMQTLQHLHEEHGNTIILITHETYTAEHATRIIKLHDGKIVSDEPVKHRLKATQFIK
ncbi:MAG: ABC transporter ATP-binding protein [Candidatus Gracilibacteria bacterium]